LTSQRKRKSEGHSRIAAAEGRTGGVAGAGEETEQGAEGTR